MSPDNVRTVVGFALELAGQPPLQPARVDNLPPGSAWRLPTLHGSWAAASAGLLHPHTHVVRPIVFDHALADGRDDVVLAHLQHRLVQMALRLLRAGGSAKAAPRHGAHRSRHCAGDASDHCPRPPLGAERRRPAPARGTHRSGRCTAPGQICSPERRRDRERAASSHPRRGATAPVQLTHRTLGRIHSSGVLGPRRARSRTHAKPGTNTARAAGERVE